MLNKLCALGRDTIGITIGCLTTLYFLVRIIYAILYFDQLLTLATRASYSNFSVAIAFVCSFLLLYVTNLFTSIMLIVGIRTKRHLLLLSWLINFGIFIIFYILDYVYTMAKLGADDISPDGITMSQMFIVFVLTFAIMYNFWSIIYSLYLLLKADFNPEDEENPLQKEQRQLEPQFILCRN